MHSRVFELQSNIDDVNTAEIDEYFKTSRCDYYSELYGDAQLEDSYDWLKGFCKTFIVESDKEKIVFDCEGIINFFDKKLETIREMIENWSGEDFSRNFKVYELQSEIEDTTGFYVIGEERYTDTLDAFLRDVAGDYVRKGKKEEDRYKTYYLGKVWDYHI